MLAVVDYDISSKKKEKPLPFVLYVGYVSNNDFLKWVNFTPLQMLVAISSSVLSLSNALMEK